MCVIENPGQPIKSIEKQKASSRAHIWLDTTKKRNRFLNRFQMSRTEKSSNKHTDLPNAISLKTEMLRKNIQTRPSHCLSPVKIFSSTSSTSVPTHVCCVEKMCRLKSPLEPQWHFILYHREVWWNCRAEGPCNLSWWYKQFEISQHPKNCAGQKTSLCMWKDFTHGHYSWYEATEMLYRSTL